MTIETDEDDNFLYFFLALRLCIRGFRTAIHPVIIVDGTFLKEKFWGTLIVAVAQDGNGQTFSVAYGVVDYDNDAS